MFKISYNIEESIIINAPINTVWNNVIYFKNSQKWSPWLILDKDCKSNISWEDWTLEAKYSWDWELVWSWEQFSTEIIENKEIKSNVIFLKPFKNIWENYFRFEEIDWNTKVIWWMKSYLPFFIFFLKNMIAKMISMDFKRGLKMLKVFSETWELNTKTNLEKNVEISEFYWFWIKNTTKMDEIWVKINSDFDKLENIAKENNIKIEWKLSFSTKKCNMMKWIMEYIASYKVNKGDFEKIKEEWDIIKWFFPKTNSLKVTHNWSYNFIDNSWTCAMASIRNLKFKQDKALNTFELYINSPKEVEEKSLITEIYIPIK